MDSKTAFTDIEVETANPEMLDQTVQQITAAVVIAGSWNGTTCKVRCFGDPEYLTFAINHQGYGRVIDGKR